MNRQQVLEQGRHMGHSGLFSPFGAGQPIPLGGKLTLLYSVNKLDTKSALEDALQQTIFNINRLGDKLVGVIAESIGREIISGTLRPGAFLKSVDLAKRFKTSRTPVREALMLLEKEGLVVIPPRRRPRVASMSLTRAKEIFRIREVLFVEVIDQVFERSTDDELKTLIKLGDAIAKAHSRADADETFRGLVQYTDALLQLTKNDTLQSILNRLRLPVIRVRYTILQDPKESARLASLLVQLAHAVVDRNAPLAKGLIVTVMEQPRAMMEAGALDLLAEHMDPPHKGKRLRKNAGKRLQKDSKHGAGARAKVSSRRA